MVVAPKAVPLEGVKVVDLTHFVAGPWATMMLADLGAVVVKVEPPGGEIARRAGAVYVGGESAIYLAFNRNKRSITCDLKSSEGRRLLDQLLAGADILIHNFRPGVAERLGVGHGRLAAAYPLLIHCSISAFGATGPRSQDPANDPIVQGISGAMLATNSDLPLRLGVPVPDFAGAVHAAIAVMAALRNRTRTGSGSAVEINLLDSQMYAQLDVIQPHLTSRSPTHDTSRGRSPHGPFQCLDGRYLWLEDVDEAAMTRLEGVAREFGVSQIGSNLELAQREIVKHIIEQHARDEWVVSLNNAGVRCVPVRTLGEVVNSAQTVNETEHPTVPGLRTMALPVSGLGRSDDSSVPPRLGQHTDAVLGELATAHFPQG